MVVIEGDDTALVIMESILEATGKDGLAFSMTRQGTYVFRRRPTGKWLCVIDNSYGTDLLKDDLVV
jgi:ketosteroid isomerase-like protein